MQISLRWINELVNLERINLEDLINKLTLGGFEVEEILEVEINKTKTTALEISATANRSDSLSIQGLSLEISALLNQIPKRLPYSTKTFPWSDTFQNLNSEKRIENDCSGFIGITIENLSNFTSPKWLQQKLLASGIPIANNLIDFQNYILVETGYPLEFYDLDKVYSEVKDSEVQFSLTPATNSLTFYAANGSEYILDKSILVLKANDLPLSIAGIISSETTNYSNNTQRLFLEASIYNAAKIRQESRTLGLRTDRSSRYEKSLKNTLLLESVYRFISLLRIANPKLSCKLHSLSQLSTDPIQIIKLSYSKVKQVLGPIQRTKTNQYEYISPEIITDALKRLQFDLIYNSDNLEWEISIPPLRSDDITREIDIIEEIGRIYGFNNFLTRLPTIQKIGEEDFDYQTRKKLTTCLVNLGLNELVQYSLVTKTTYLKNEIELVNPLVTEYSNLRSSLLPNLVKAVEENVKKGNSALEGFEYGHVFSKNSSSNISETEYLAGILGGVKIKSNWSKASNPLSWFEAKGKIEQLFQKLNLIVYWKSYKPIKESTILHLYCSAELFLSNGTKLGIFGQISPILARKLNISTDIYLFEFNFEVLKSQIYQNKLSIYQEYSFYPKIVKDLSFIVKDTIPFSQIQELLYFNGSRFLKEVHLLDEYRGNSIPQNSTSLCLQLVFQSDFETLQNERVEKIINNLTNVLTKKFNAILRG